MKHFEWPKTVKEWRDGGWKPDGSQPYDLWKREPLQKFFQDQGYTLWISEYEQGLGDIYNVQLHPPNDEPRWPDSYTFVSCYQCQPGILIYKPELGQANSIHCPARTIHNQDVLIRLINIDDDATGDDHYKAIRRLSQGQTDLRGDNYMFPLLNEQINNDRGIIEFGWPPSTTAFVLDPVPVSPIVLCYFPVPQNMMHG